MQNYHNHIRFYKPHHFVFYPMVLLFIGLSIIGIIQDPANKLIWMMFLCVWVVVTWVAFMMRQHYALTLQDRIIRIETRFRYYKLTQKDFELLEPQLTFEQIAALRFASDAEFLTLLQKALDEKLGGKSIKQKIKNWKADTERV